MEFSKRVKKWTRQNADCYKLGKIL